jgi:hypothetical protein
MKAKKLLSRLRVDKPVKFRLVKCDPSDTCGLDIDKDDAKTNRRAAKGRWRR